MVLISAESRPSSRGGAENAEERRFESGALGGYIRDIGKFAHLMCGNDRSGIGYSFL